MSMKNPWVEYRSKDKHVIRFTLDVLGLPDFWVRVKNLSVMTPAEIYDFSRQVQEKHKRHLAEAEAAQAELSAKAESGELTQDDLEIEPPTAIGILERELIEAWNLTDPETGEALALPSEDPRVLLRLPNEVQRYINEWTSNYLTNLNKPLKSHATS